jgi:hypothetical protein
MGDKGQGWHKDSEEHAEAAKGQKPKTGNSSSGEGQGWHKDSEGHSEAAKGSSPNQKGLMDKIKGD